MRNLTCKVRESKMEVVRLGPDPKEPEQTEHVPGRHGIRM